jgi:nitrogen-specific signal transduction histidine kinase
MASEMHSLKLPLKYQALELVQYPVVLVDRQYRLVHFNTAFAGLLQEIDAVFPPKDLMEVFPDFLQGLFSAESGR